MTLPIEQITTGHWWIVDSGEKTVVHVDDDLAVTFLGNDTSFNSGSDVNERPSHWRRLRPAPEEATDQLARTLTVDGLLPHK
jgi:hypothetical protein